MNLFKDSTELVQDCSNILLVINENSNIQIV